MNTIKNPNSIQQVSEQEQAHRDAQGRKWAYGGLIALGLTFAIAIAGRVGYNIGAKDYFPEGYNLAKQESTAIVATFNDNLDNAISEEWANACWEEGDTIGKLVGSEVQRVSLRYKKVARALTAVYDLQAPKLEFPEPPKYNLVK